MSRHHRVVRILLAACALQATASACMAQTLNTSTFRVSWQSQGSGGMLTGGVDKSLAFSFENGQWLYQGSGALLLSWNPSQPNAGLGTLDLHFDFQPWHLRLDSNWELVVTSHPDQMSLRTLSRFVAPPDAQLATARGLNRWRVTAAGTEHFGAEVSPVAVGSLDSSVDLTPPVWATAPQGGGHWDLSVTQTLIGSYHLVTSSDSGCQSPACMPGERADASLQSLQFYLPQTIELRAITSSVPEPAVPALLAVGLGILALRGGRLGRVGAQA